MLTSHCGYRTFGLGLLEALLTGYSAVFYTHQPLSLLLKERVFSLVIKLFSPNIKYKYQAPLGTLLQLLTSLTTQSH